MISVAMLTACTGQRTGVLPTTPNAAPRVQPRAQLRAQPPRLHGKGHLTIEIHVPRRTHRAGRGSRYISASTRGANLVLTGTQTVIKSVALTPGANKVALSLEAGTYTASITTYNAAPVGGSIPSWAKLLSTASNLPLKIVKGKQNTANFTLEGVIASLAIAAPSAPIGTATAKPFSVIGKDAGGNTIVGTYNEPITVTDVDSDSGGHTSVVTAGADHPTAGKLLSSSDTATLSYDGSHANFSASIHASATGVTTASATFAPNPVLTSISLTTGLDGTLVSQTINGEFANGYTDVVVPDGSGVWVLEQTIADDTFIHAYFFIDPHTAAAGPISVRVRTAATATSEPKTFTISTTGVDIVTKNTDTASTCNGSASGELRYAMCNATAGDTIVFDTAAMCSVDGVYGTCTITLDAPLPPIGQNQTIDGGSFAYSTPRVEIDGAGKYRAFYVDGGTVSLTNLQIQNVLAQGGQGGAGKYDGGGGGAGLGGGLLAYSSTVNVTSDYFLNCEAVGGNGGAFHTSSSGDGGGGGGGLGGAGADAPSSTTGGNGGGGFLAAGSGASDTTGGAGNDGGGNGGSFGIASVAAGGNGSTFGGGGGGYGAASGLAGTGGTGGFFGGGGGGSYGASASNGGDGGPGGGGGGGGVTAGSGGIIYSSLQGGSGSSYSGTQGNGGGGAAAGPAIFVYDATLNTSDSDASGCTATGGTGGSGDGIGLAPGGDGTADSTPVYSLSSYINGSLTDGAASSALSNGIPSIRKFHRRKPLTARRFVGLQGNLGERRSR